MPFTRRQTLAAAAGAFALAAGPAGAQTFPNRQMRFVVPFPPGGSLDASTRILADRLTALLGQTVVVENRPGAGGNTGADVVAKSAPDGYTLLTGALSTHAVNPHLYRTMPFDALRDFIAVSQTGHVPNVLIVRTESPVTDLRDLIARIRAAPAEFNYGSGGNGSGGHLAGALFNNLTGLSVPHIPFQGGAPALNALLGGTTQFMFDNLANAWGQLTGRRVRAIAVTTAQRSAFIPETPTMTEAGLAGFDISTWWGTFVPAGTPQPIVEQLSRTLATILREPAVVERFRALGTDPVGNTPAEFSAFVRAEHEKYREIVRLSGARVD